MHYADALVVVRVSYAKRVGWVIPVIRDASLRLENRAQSG
jgi:hypothetical protein